MRNGSPIPFPTIRHTQNRDRLELYALHKQAISGDAPATLATQTAAERAKYQSWKSKSGLSQTQAIRLYLQEADRQIRVYGGGLISADTLNGSFSNGTSTPVGQEAPPQQPRGLAAIPLLCAAASESRPAYLRRLANTRLEQAWWRRQEPLTATPSSVWAFPESALLAVASFLEYVSLTCDGRIPLPSGVVQSFLWPLHNCFLSLWMAYILIITAWTAAWEMLQTVIWGSRRTGLALDAVWKDQVQWTAQSARILTESHQPLTARLMGLVLWPFSALVVLASSPGQILWQAVVYCLLLGVSWWYWFLVLPTLAFWLLGLAVVAGNCFGLIELAGV